MRLTLLYILVASLAWPVACHISSNSKCKLPYSPDMQFRLSDCPDLNLKIRTLSDQSDFLRIRFFDKNGELQVPTKMLFYVDECEPIGILFHDITMAIPRGSSRPFVNHGNNGTLLRCPHMIHRPSVLSIRFQDLSPSNNVEWIVVNALSMNVDQSIDQVAYRYLDDITPDRFLGLGAKTSFSLTVVNSFLSLLLLALNIFCFYRLNALRLAGSPRTEPKPSPKSNGSEGS